MSNQRIIKEHRIIGKAIGFEQKYSIQMEKQIGNPSM